MTTAQVYQERVGATGNGKFALLDDEILQLAGWACLIEDHYSQVRGIYTPMDIEWAKDGITGKLFVSKPAQKTIPG